MGLEVLNEKYRSLSPIERVAALYEDFDPNGIMVTSSFGTTSALLLHMVSRTRSEQAIHVIDTGYLFEATEVYREYLTLLFDLKIEMVKADKAGHQYTQKEQLWKTEPDICCGINKTMPIEEARENYQVWVAGLLGHQNAHRKNLNVFEEKGGIIRFYPLLDMDEEAVKSYFKEHRLPEHPLKAKGYDSVGCTHCTVKGKGRAGRWLGNMKTECGLHT